MVSVYRRRYYDLLAVLEDFKVREHIDNDVLFEYLRELLKSRNY